jgi:hypothetical protein
MEPTSQSLTSPSASGLNSPLAPNNLSLFSGFGSAASAALPILPTGSLSRDPSRAGTPAGQREGEKGFSRFGAFSSRLFRKDTSS